MSTGFEGKHLHFVGVGGYGMSGLAQVLHDRGFSVSGCDARLNSRTSRLENMGVVVHEGHDTSHLDGVDAVVYSTDVPPSNPELVAARKRGLDLLHRSGVLGWFLNAGHGVAVTGTHGKTTTTAIIGLAMRAASLDPTVFVGGEVPDLGGTASPGRGDWVVAEACESDGSFLTYRPRISVITNVEPEHLDYYGGCVDGLVAAFQQYIDATPDDGILITGADDRRLMSLQMPPRLRTRTFGMAPASDVRAVDIDQRPGVTSWTVTVDGVPVHRLSSSLLGHHNVMNATAAAAVCLETGVGLEHLNRALAGFRGVDRRFQVVTGAGDVTVVSDYAHHPTEIAATITAARQAGPKRIIAVFQPQRYARTRSLWDAFAGAFGGADHIILTEIYAPVGEDPVEGVSGGALAAEVSRRSDRPTAFLPSLDDVESRILDMVEPGDMVLVMGAGDIYRVAERVGAELDRGRRAM